MAISGMENQSLSTSLNNTPSKKKKTLNNIYQKQNIYIYVRDQCYNITPLLLPLKKIIILIPIN